MSGDDTARRGVRRWPWVVGCVVAAITVPLQVGAAAVAMRMLPDRESGWRGTTEESAESGARNAGLLVALLAAAAAVAFIAWLLIWGFRELARGRRSCDGRGLTDADEAVS